jgi:ribosomal protein S9
MKVTKQSMIEYCKTILPKFTFSARLFRKEYKKCFRYLDPTLHNDFRTWARKKFGNSAVRSYPQMKAS